PALEVGVVALVLRRLLGHDGLAEVGADLFEAPTDLPVGEGLDLWLERVGLVDERLDPFQLTVVRVDETGKEIQHGAVKYMGGSRESRPSVAASRLRRPRRG